MSALAWRRLQFGFTTAFHYLFPQLTMGLAELAIVGEPNVAEHRPENPVRVPWALSFLAYGSFGATVTGLDDAPADQRPDNIELLHYPARDRRRERGLRRPFPPSSGS